MSKELLEAVSFRIDTEEGLYLSGDVQTIRDGVPKPVLILGHGFRGHKDWGFWPEIAGRFAERGFYTVRFNFARIGAIGQGADGQLEAQAATLSRELDDWETIVTTILENRLPLADTETDKSRLAILGHSRAGSTAILYAEEHPEVRAVAVWNGGGAPNRPSAAAGQKLSVKDRAIADDLDRNAGRYRVKETFAGLPIPALVVQGGADNERLLGYNRELRAAAPGQTFVEVAGGDHTFGAGDPYAGPTEALEQAFRATAAFLDGTFRQQ